MKRLVMIAMVLLVYSFAAPRGAQAQVHPCDVVIAANPQVTVPTRMGFCHNAKDANGGAIILTSFTVRIDGLVVFTGLPVAIGAPSATGFVYYEVPVTTLTRGTHSAVVTASDIDGESLPSSPFAFGVVGLVPGAPVKVRAGGT